MRQSRYTLSYGHDAPFSRTAKLMLCAIGAIFGSFLLHELDAALGIAWGSSAAVPDKILYDVSRMIFGAAALLSFQWATRTTAVKITSH